MAKSEVYTFEFTCDGRCGKKVRVEVKGVRSASRPEGWHHVEVRDCGSTGYTRDEDWCAECYASRKSPSE